MADLRTVGKASPILVSNAPGVDALAVRARAAMQATLWRAGTGGWLGGQDSNLDSQIQSLMAYR